MQLNICRGRDYRLSDLLYMFHNQPDRVLVAGLVVALIDTVVQIPFYYVTYMVNPVLKIIPIRDTINTKISLNPMQRVI